MEKAHLFHVYLVVSSGNKYLPISRIQYLPFYKLQWSIVLRYSQIYVENFETYAFKLRQKKKKHNELARQRSQSVIEGVAPIWYSDYKSCENIYIFFC